VRFLLKGSSVRRALDHQGAFCRVETRRCCEQLSQTHRPRSSVARRRSDSARLLAHRFAFARPSPAPACGGFPLASAHVQLALRLAVHTTRDASDRRLPPNTFTTSTRASRVFEPSSGSKSAAFHDAAIRFDGLRHRRHGVFSSPRQVHSRVSGAPVASLVRPARPSGRADLRRDA